MLIAKGFDWQLNDLAPRVTFPGGRKTRADVTVGHASRKTIKETVKYENNIFEYCRFHIVNVMFYFLDLW